MKPPYRCLYNHELLILFNTETPYQSYRTPVTDDMVTGYVKELRGTGVDAIMICPQAWMTHLWPSEVDPRWQQPETVRECLPEDDVRYFEKVYQRVSRYMRQGKDPVALSIDTARAVGIAPFLSYRMNENHYTHCEDCPTHSAFWKAHPELRVGRIDGNLDYGSEAVRAYFLSVIFELLERYDVEGFECDFMRQAVYFTEDMVGEGAELMTEFVRAIRQKLDALGKVRGKRLWLSVRVPALLGEVPAPGQPLDPERRKIGQSSAGDAGLDVARWEREGLIDMVNVSPNYLTSQEVDIRGYRAVLNRSVLFGEMHFITQLATMPSHPATIQRMTTRECYRTTALRFLEQGADGISLFNFAYTREHSYRDPRRQFYPGVEPPFDVIESLNDPEKLRSGDQYVFRVFGYGGASPLSLPGQKDTEIELVLPDVFAQPFSRVLLRLEMEERVTHLPIDVRVNNVPGEVVLPNGELFSPLSLEALPESLCLKQFSVPVSAFGPGMNRILIRNRFCGSGGSGYVRGRLRLKRIEAALYR